ASEDAVDDEVAGDDAVWGSLHHHVHSVPDQRGRIRVRGELAGQQAASVIVGHGDGGGVRERDQDETVVFVPLVAPGVGGGSVGLRQHVAVVVPVEGPVGRGHALHDGVGGYLVEVVEGSDLDDGVAAVSLGGLARHVAGRVEAVGVSR